jgi:hypothetical protein
MAILSSNSVCDRWSLMAGAWVFSLLTAACGQASPPTSGGPATSTEDASPSMVLGAVAFPDRRFCCSGHPCGMGWDTCYGQDGGVASCFDVDADCRQWACLGPDDIVYEIVPCDPL